jgi:AraC-like DNA-binding protein
MRDGEPSAEATAAAMHITSRTLHRRLANEGTNFRLLLQQTRHQLAQQYLQDSRLQLVEVAQLLGYSEQSALSRAFKDWSGQTPAQYRRQATH